MFTPVAFLPWTDLDVSVWDTSFERVVRQRRIQCEFGSTDVFSGSVQAVAAGCLEAGWRAARSASAPSFADQCDRFVVKREAEELAYASKRARGSDLGSLWAPSSKQTAEQHVVFTAKIAKAAELHAIDEREDVHLGGSVAQDAGLREEPVHVLLGVHAVAEDVRAQLDALLVSEVRLAHPVRKSRGNVTWQRKR